MNLVLANSGPDVHAEVQAIVGDPQDGPVRAAQYERAAQLIACRRGACDGPETEHEHAA